MIHPSGFGSIWGKFLHAVLWLACGGCPPHAGCDQHWQALKRRALATQTLLLLLLLLVLFV